LKKLKAPIRSSHSLNTHSDLPFEHGVCSTGHPVSAEAGAWAIQQGGTAVDAMVAAAFTSFVVEPASCGLGGYGHFSVYLAKEDRYIGFDAYCRAPLSASPDMYELDMSSPATYYGHPRTVGNKAEHGPLAPAVPGAVAGCCDLLETHGTLPLDTVLVPAITAAEKGIPFLWSDLLHIAGLSDTLSELPDTDAVLRPGGRLSDTYECSASLDGKALAKTLRLIAQKGKAGFYQGRVAKAIEQYVQGLGGILSRQDLAQYAPRIWHEPAAHYRDYRYISCFDQVAYEALNILDGYDLAKYGADSYAYRHLVAEALGVAFTDNMTWYGDPDFENAPIQGLTDPRFAAKRRKDIRMRRAIDRPIQPGNPWPYDPGFNNTEGENVSPTQGKIAGTSQVAVADRAGNLASCCISVGSAYGSRVYVPEVGIFLNDAMQNFDPRPNHLNSIHPGKMPIFAAPALVACLRDQGRFAASGSGGYRIQTGVLHTFMNYVDHQMDIQKAVDHPRVHCQGQETVADSQIPEKIRTKLKQAGHNLTTVSAAPGRNHFGRICAVSRDPSSGELRGGAGPSWSTGIAGV
tara:strand:+ start:2566 stop:4287 length:1722 start_codon:yes stop_codon:yes gene_type:complete